MSASPDGRYVAVGVCEDGSERNTIRLIEADSGERLPAPAEPLMDNWTGGAHWLPDSSWFFFSASVDPQHRVLLYRLASGRTTEVDAPWSSPLTAGVRSRCSGSWRRSRSRWPTWTARPS
ncbi:hypothetical protein [Crossiella equi]|uniref:hypothetical protein n=1 Tax=Crossiella equi TaxID=130796 RepID=UPI003B849644